GTGAPLKDPATSVATPPEVLSGTPAQPAPGPPATRTDVPRRATRRPHGTAGRRQGRRLSPGEGQGVPGV
ncbi:hypothetical protein NGM37_00460, partial [Streptomyces sp. TRM76130]|nr:hypothetical protein [Streptomyces sp. TRM76130]